MCGAKYMTKKHYALMYVRLWDSLKYRLDSMQASVLSVCLGMSKKEPSMHGFGFRAHVHREALSSVDQNKWLILFQNSLESSCNLCT